MIRLLALIYNLLRYQCHLETMKFCKVYEPYDFSKDWRSR